MISGTYILSGVLLGGTGFFLGDVTAVTLTLMGCIIFFFASAGASAAYLTASEVFPMETRALCIAFFYAIGTAVGGITGPLLLRQAHRRRLRIGRHHRDRHRLLRRRRADDRRRHRRGLPRRQGRGSVAGEPRPAADRRGRRGDRRPTTTAPRSASDRPTPDPSGGSIMPMPPPKASTEGPRDRHVHYEIGQIVRASSRKARSGPRTWPPRSAPSSGSRGGSTRPCRWPSATALLTRQGDGRLRDDLGPTRVVVRWPRDA